MAVKNVITLGIGASPTSLLWFFTSGLGILGSPFTPAMRVFTPADETRAFTPVTETRVYTPPAE